MRTPKSLTVAITALLAGAAALQGCSKSENPVATAAVTPPSAAAQQPTVTPVQPVAAPATQAAYTPPTAAQLISLLAPVAVFPDKLVAQVLAASAYPDQVSAANTWLSQNPDLKDTALQQAVSAQPWDPSVKALVQFPQVLQQMAGNVPWMTALGNAYVNDPADVMNAVQTLRAQAIAAGHLKSNKYLKVTTVPKQEEAPAAAIAPPPPPQDSGASYVDDTPPPPVYDGPPVIEPPQQVIEIAPADPYVVYVPQYDPLVFFGTPIVPYYGYSYVWPAPVYVGPFFGGIGFGFGISLNFGWGYPWGWGAWALNWGPGFGFPWYGWDFHRPCVVYNNRIYVSHSTTVINHYAAAGIANRPVAGTSAARFAGTAPRPLAGAANASFASARATAAAAAAASRPLAAAAAAHMTMPNFTRAMATPEHATSANERRTPSTSFTRTALASTSRPSESAMASRSYAASAHLASAGYARGYAQSATGYARGGNTNSHSYQYGATRGDYRSSPAANAAHNWQYAQPRSAPTYNSTPGNMTYRAPTQYRQTYAPSAPRNFAAPQFHAAHSAPAPSRGGQPHQR